MWPADRHSPVIVVVGPTAVGKTKFSIKLAGLLDGEIISADSRYFYRGMNIGTAKPTPDEMLDVKHHLINVANPDQTWNLALFQSEATKAINAIHDREKLPILVGGTGQYIQAVLENWEIPEQVPDQLLRVAIEKWADQIGAQSLHQKLSIIDPIAAGNIEYQNQRRTIRALEVIFGTGRRFSDQRRKKISPYELKIIGLIRPRIELYQRIDERIDWMMENGLIAEVQGLLAAGYAKDLPAFSAIGYREVIEYLEGKMSLEEAIILMKRKTREFVRRQANWFKSDNPNIYWVKADEIDFEEIINFIYSNSGWVNSIEPKIK